VAVNSSDERDLRERQSPLGEIVDGAVRRLSTSIAIAGALIALAIYARPGPPTYQSFSTESGSIVRVNTRTGWIFECVEGRCGTVVRPGQRLAPRPPAKALPAPAATPAAPSGQKALPSPAAAPALPPNPAPAPAPDKQ
jgi:hypothetical protein